MSRLDPVRLVRYLNRATKQVLSIRRPAIAAYRTATRVIRFLPPPRALLNGPSKSGTHLLSDCVASLPGFMYSGRHFGVAPEVRRPRDTFRVPQDLRQLERFLDQCPNGMFVTAHAEHDQQFHSLLSQLGFRHVLLVRDPRDIAVSRALFRANLKWHPHHQYLSETLQSDEERIMAIIMGVEASPEMPIPIRPLGEGLRAFLPWLETDAVLTVKFEDLIGGDGGGSREKQIATVTMIGSYLSRPVSTEAATSIVDRVYAKPGFTYRKGAMGDWHDHFNSEHLEAFQETAGDLIAAMGYGTDQ